MQHDSYIDTWLWRFNRLVAEFVNHPSDTNARKLRELMHSYQQRHPQTSARAPGHHRNVSHRSS